MKNFQKILFLLILALFVHPGIVKAEPEAPPPPPAAAVEKGLELLKDIEVHGFISSAWNYNFNDPTNRVNNLRVFDQDHNSFKLDVGELVLKKDAAKPGDVGFRTDLIYGYSVPRVTKATPLPGAPTRPARGSGNDVDAANPEFEVQQGYASYNAPIGNGLRFDLGKFITNMGAEVIEGYDNWNYNYSHSFLFGFAIPFTHTGLKAAYTINDQLSVQGMVANGWDNETDTNNGKLWHVNVGYNPLSNVSMVFNWMGGPEEPQAGGPINEKNWRHLYDWVGTIGLTDNLLLVLNVDYGHEEMNSALRRAQDADWWGFAGVLRHQYNQWLAFNLRGEFFNDDDGARTGTKQELWEMTLTPEFRVNKNLIIRPEYRHDHSNTLAFGSVRGVLTDKDQDTIAVNAMFFF